MSKKSTTKGSRKSHNRSRKSKGGLWAAIGALCAVAVAGIALCVYFILNPSQGKKDYNYYVDLAQRYASEQRYEDAVEQYWVAINMDETQEDAYLGLGEVYEETQQTYNAMNIYSLGFQRTNSAVLNNKYLTISQLFSGEAPLENQVEKNLEVAILVNRTLMSRFSAYGFEQYTQTYGEPEVRSVSNVADLRTTGTAAQVQFPNLNAVLYYYNTDSDARVLDATGRPGADKAPGEIALNDLSLLFAGMDGKITYEELSDTQLGLEELSFERDSALNRYIVRFRVADCQVFIETDQEGTIQSEGAWNRIYPGTGNRSENDNSGIAGQVVSAVDGSGVMDAQLSLVSADTGEVVQEITSDADGSYTFDAAPNGDYLIRISAENYMEDEFELTLDGVEDNSEKSLAISPLMAEGEIRFVLSWEESPRDLDSYLKGTATDGSDLLVCYYNQQSYNRDGKVTAELDTDDTDGFGPETITLKDVGGEYEMVVVDYLTTGTMGSTDATVRIYTSDSSPIEVKVNPAVQNIWHVCTVKDGKIEVTNEAADDEQLRPASK